MIALITGFGVMGFIGPASADNDKDNDRGYRADNDRRDDDRNNGNRPSAREEIKELMSCYAYSFDAIARAATATGTDPNNWEYLSPINMADPYFAEGYERFRSCTTEDFVIEAYELNGNPLLQEGDIPAGPLPWVNVINFLSRLDGTGVTSQHLFGSFRTTVDGNTGTLTAYAIITGYNKVVVDDEEVVQKGPGGTSTYTSDVVYQGGKWLLKKTTLVEN
jgi:hypothetical protein